MIPAEVRTRIEKLPRYDLISNYRCGDSIEEMERADDGEWVRVETVLAALASLPTEQEHESRSPDGDGPWSESVEAGSCQRRQSRIATDRAHELASENAARLSRNKSGECGADTTRDGNPVSNEPAGSEPADSHHPASVPTRTHTAGDLYFSALDEWFQHGRACEAETCDDCTLLLNRVRLAEKVHRNSSHKAASVPTGPEELEREIAIAKAESHAVGTSAQLEAFVEDRMRYAFRLGALSSLQRTQQEEEDKTRQSGAEVTEQGAGSLRFTRI